MAPLLDDAARIHDSNHTMWMCSSLVKFKLYYSVTGLYEHE